MFTQQKYPAQMSFALFLLFLPILLLCRVAVAQEPVLVGGTGTGSQLIDTLSQAYLKRNPTAQVKVMLPSMGSGGSLRALESGAIQIAIVTFPPSSTEKNTTEPTTQATPWMTTPLVFTGKNARNKDKISLAQVTAYYSGSIKQWPNGKPVRLVTRSERESDTRILRSISPEMDSAVLQSTKRSEMLFAENDIENQKFLENTPDSFGSVALGQLLLSNSPLKPFQLDGVLPSAQTLKAKTYKIEKPLYLVFSRTPSHATHDFIKYLQSAEAMKLANRYGFIEFHQ